MVWSTQVEKPWPRWPTSFLAYRHPGPSGLLPAGEITESAINQLAYLLSPGDTVLDGGNANYKDSIRRATALKEKGLSFIDAAPAAEYGDWPRATA